MQPTSAVEHVLPSYTPHAIRRGTLEVEHSYRLMRQGHPLLTLTVKSGAADVQSTPIMRQGHTITGCVTLDLQEGMRIRAINVQVRHICTHPCLVCLGFPIPTCCCHQRELCFMFGTSCMQ